MADDPIDAMPVIQGSDEIFTTRQVGINPEDTRGIEDAKFAQQHPVIQGSADIFTTRQTGLGQRIDASGTLHADRPLEAGTPTLRSDRPTPPPARAPAPPVVDVVRSDDGGADPRDASGGPQVLSADALPVIKNAPIVPVVVVDQALPKAKKGKG
jgi:hypothetical protein